MIRVDFYVLDSEGSHLRELYACRVTEKAYKLGHSVYIHVSDDQQAQALDDMLWTFSQGSFIPHARCDAAVQPDTPVHIGYGKEPDFTSDVLINLAPAVPSFYSRFERVVEIVDQSEAVKSKGRERFKFYREHQCDVNSHNVGR